MVESRGISVPTARLWFRLFKAFEKKLLKAMAENGFEDITVMHLNVIRHLSPEGMSATQLAKDAGITKQAVGKIASSLERKGYLDFEIQAEDGRIKRWVYTKKGKKLLDQLIHQTKIIEGDFSRCLGEVKYAQLRASLERLLDDEWSRL